MPRFLIEVPHDPDTVACARIVKTFFETGSHLVTKADWGCRDGDHRGWLVVEAADREEARSIVPLPIRGDARIIGLNRFTVEEIDEILAQHG